MRTFLPVHFDVVDVFENLRIEFSIEMMHEESVVGVAKVNGTVGPLRAVVGGDVPRVLRYVEEILARLEEIPMPEHDFLCQHEQYRTDQPRFSASPRQSGFLRTLFSISLFHRLPCAIVCMRLLLDVCTLRSLSDLSPHNADEFSVTE